MGPEGRRKGSFGSREGEAKGEERFGFGPGGDGESSVEEEVDKPNLWGYALRLHVVERL